MAGDGPDGVLGEVVPQMPAVGDLDGVRCAVTGGFGVGAGPVAADHPCARVRLEPVLQRASLAAGQDVDRAAGGGVDQDGGVDVPSAQREVIDLSGVDLQTTVFPLVVTSRTRLERASRC